MIIDGRTYMLGQVLSKGSSKGREKWYVIQCNTMVQFLYVLIVLIY